MPNKIQEWEIRKLAQTLWFEMKIKLSGRMSRILKVFSGWWSFSCYLMTAVAPSLLQFCNEALFSDQAARNFLLFPHPNVN